MLKIAQWVAMVALAYVLAQPALAETRPMVVTNHDLAMAKSAQNIVLKTMPPVGQSSQKFFALKGSDPLKKMERAKTARSINQFDDPVPPGSSVRQLIDHGGPRMTGTQFNMVFVNQPESHWGNIRQFIYDLAHSDLYNMMQQYVLSGPNPFNIIYNIEGDTGPGFQYSMSFRRSVIFDFQIRSLAYASQKAQVFGGGYNNAVAVFIPEGVTVCMDFAQTNCYTPSDPSTTKFCGYHGSFDASDLGHIVYAALPYAGVAGCNYGSPFRVDSQYTVLSHELFELLTDPDLNAWYDADGQEIADKCNVDMAFLVLNTTYYYIQREYSNQAQACATALSHPIP